MPEPLLTELSRVWLFTLEYLRAEVAMTHVPRTSSRSLRHFAYNNSVPSFAMRPVLLAGQRVHTLLAATIRPRTRTLKFRVSIPRLIPGDLPPIRCTVALTQLRWGGLFARSRFALFWLPHLVLIKQLDFFIPWRLENRATHVRHLKEGPTWASHGRFRYFGVHVATKFHEPRSIGITWRTMSRQTRSGFQHGSRARRGGLFPNLWLQYLLPAKRLMGLSNYM